jgi:hypothetical protein
MYKNFDAFWCLAQGAATNGLPSPPYDKSTSNHAIALFVFPLSRFNEHRLRPPHPYVFVCVTHIVWASVHTSLNGYIRFSCCLTPGAQRLMDFPLLLTISQHRIVLAHSSCFLYLMRSGPVHTSLNGRLLFFLLKHKFFIMVANAKD